MSLNLDRVLSLLKNDDSVECPHCGHQHPISDPDVSSAVVSYWGDELHDFCCGSCGMDFVVKENVTRKFKSARPDCVEDIE